MLRDKDYLRTNDGLLFNVIGYEHESDRASANLKYVHGTKWTSGYESALTFLSSKYPCYVDGLIRVPHSQVAEIYRPQDGLRRIFARTDRNDLEQAAVDLARACSTYFELPLVRFGVTDSLLWSRGRHGSDIDLVVYGSDSAAIVLKHIRALYQLPGFERLGVETFTRQSESTIGDAQLRELCKRKANKGLFQGVRFTLRAVRAVEEIEPSSRYQAAGPIELTERVADNSESLFFPATYKMDSGLHLVSFMMRHEGVFEAGEVLTIRGMLEQGPRDQVVVGNLHQEGHGIDVVDTGSMERPGAGGNISSQSLPWRL
jgi:uncharacterized protein